MPSQPGSVSAVERLLWLPERHGLIMIGERGRCHLLEAYNGKLKPDVVRKATTWTVLEQDGPDHLGL